MDQGFRIKVDDAQKTILIVNEDGAKIPATSPVLLDGTGGKLADPSMDSAKYISRQVYNKKDFSALPLV